TIYTYSYIWVCALYTQGRYMGMRPLYAGMIHGSAPFIRRDDIWVWALYTQGCWPGIMYIFGSVPRYTGIWPGMIYIHTHNTKHIYVCAHVVSESRYCGAHTRCSDCFQGTRPVTVCLLVMSVQYGCRRL